MQRTCVVGMGHIGHRHARAYTESDKAELVAVCDRVPELAKAAGEKFGVPYFTKASEMYAAMKPGTMKSIIQRTTNKPFKNIVSAAFFQ